MEITFNGKKLVDPDAVGYFSKTQKRLRKQFLRGLGNSENRDFAID